MSKSRLFATLLCLAVAPMVHAKTVLPDSCGDDKVQFDVKGVDDHSQSLTPEAGKALLVFVEENTEWDTLATIRLGIDGTWVGATHGSQYFLVQLTPGEHHLCASMQHKFGMGSPEHFIGMETLNAEAGKVYYYGAVVGMKMAGVYGNGNAVGSSKKVTVQYSLMNEDDGKYRVKAGKLAISTPQQ